jgi:hypothetical protein
MALGAALPLSLQGARARAVPALVIGFAAVCALLLILPGQTVTTRYLGDLTLLLDGAYRVVEGQVPHRDFHSPLGPLAFYFPGAGYALSGSFGLAMPAATALMLALLAPAIAYVLSSRLHPALALPFGAFLIVVLAVPINLGEGITALSFAKFYNRLGWVALAALLVMYLRPGSFASRHVIDAAVATLLTVVMAYTKMTYGVAALAFLVFMLTDREQRVWAAMALGFVLATGLLVEFFWQSSGAYLADLLTVHRVDGSLRGNFGQILDHALGNTADYVLLALFAGMALRRRASFRDAIFYLACAVGGFLLINQNFQAWGILSLHAAAAVAAEKILRVHAELPEAGGRWDVSSGAKLLFLTLTLPTIVHCVLALGLHASAAVSKAGDDLAIQNLGRIRVANLWTWGDHEALLAEAARAREAVGAISALNPPHGPVVTLGSPNIFSAALGTPPAHGDWPWLQWDRTLNGTDFPPPEALFQNARVVVEAKDPEPSSPPPSPTQAERLRTVYGPYLAERFTVASETAGWRVHLRRSAP